MGQRRLCKLTVNHWQVNQTPNLLEETYNLCLWTCYSSHMTKIQDWRPWQMAMALFSANIVNQHIFTCINILLMARRIASKFPEFWKFNRKSVQLLNLQKRELMPWLMINLSVKFIVYNEAVRKHSSLCLPREKATELKNNNKKCLPVAASTTGETDKLFVLDLN